MKISVSHETQTSPSPILQKTSILFIAHGSRITKANEEIRTLIEIYKKEYPQFPVKLSFIELAKPSIEEAIDALLDESLTNKEKPSKIILCPILLFRAGHAKNDLPIVSAKMRQKYPHVSFHITDVLGVHPEMIELLLMRYKEAIVKKAKSSLKIL